MIDWRAVVPFIGPESNMIALIDDIEVDLLERFTFVDNTPSGVLSSARFRHLPIYGAEIVSHPENLGIAASWNVGLRKRAEFTVCMSASVRFPAGFRQWLREVEQHASPWGLKTKLQGHLIVLGRTLTDEIGFADENFYPTGWDDNDWYMRMILAGRMPGQTQYGTKPDGTIAMNYAMSCTTAGFNLAVNATKTTSNDPALIEYYLRKWGSHSEVNFKTPFNDPSNGLDYWPPTSVAENKKRYGLK